MQEQDPLSPNAKLDRLADSGRRKGGEIKGVAVLRRKWIRMPQALTTTLSSSWRTRRRVCPRRRRRRWSSKGALGWWTPALYASWASTTGSPNCCHVCIPSARGAFQPPPGPLTRDGTRKSNSTAIKHVRKYICWCYVWVCSRKQIGPVNLFVASFNFHGSLLNLRKSFGQ